MYNRIIPAMTLFAVLGCDPYEPVDGRRTFAEFDCSVSPCLGRWEDSQAWSPVYPWNDIAALQTFDPSTLWPCNPEPDADICVIVDPQGHKGCFRYDLGFAVAVAPACLNLSPDWIDVGNGMEAKVTAYN